MEKVFNIDSAERLKNNYWRVQGRAYEDVHMGDVLTVYSSSNSNPVGTLTVIDIVAYGKHTPELSRMMTGTLILKGEDYGLLQQASFLYR